jgi:purine-binding chemotaxis protein CheW
LEPGKMGLVVVFQLETQRFGLPLDSVERVVRTVEHTVLPNAPQIVLGVVNVQGRIIPVIDMRQRLRLPERRPRLTDQLLIVNSTTRTLALVIDAVAAVTEFDAVDFTAADHIVPGLEFLAGVVKLNDDIILVHNLDQFLSLEEEQILDGALRNA